MKIGATQELLGQLLAGNLQDEGFIEHLWRTYDPEILSGMFQRVKSLADDCFRAKNFGGAVEHYTACILLVRNSGERSKLYSNRSLCFYKDERFEHAYSDALKCLALTPKWPKAWYRCAAALVRLNEPELALTCIETSFKYLEDDADQRAAITSEIEMIKNLVARKKRQQRYQTDYQRFDQLAKLVDEKQRETTAAADIEFNDDSLDENQKNYLRAQLGCEVPARSSANVSRALRSSQTHKIALDWRGRAQQAAPDSRAIQILKEFLLLQAYSAFPARLLGFVETGVASRFAERIRARLATQPSQRTVLLGSGSVLCALALAECCEQVVVITESAMHIDLISHLASVEVEKEDGGLRFMSKKQLIEIITSKNHRAVTEPTASVPAEVLEGVVEHDSQDLSLRRKGEHVILKASTSAQKSREVDYSVLKRISALAIDPDWICPYLLGPNNPLKLMKLLPDAQLLLPGRVTLNVALAWISHTPNLDGEPFDCYSILPLSLPTSASAQCHLSTDFAAAWTLNEFSELPMGPKQSDNVLTIDVAQLKGKRDRSFNALLFSLTFWDGAELFLDTWELYQECAEAGMELRVLAPHFYWLTPDQQPCLPAPAVATRASNASPRLLSALFDGDQSVPREPRSTDTETPGRRRGMRRSSSSSSSSSCSNRHLQSRWVSEVKRGMLSSRTNSRERTHAQSSPTVRTPYREAHKICLQLVNGCLAGANVFTESACYTSSENRVVSNNLAGLDWHTHYLLGTLDREISASSARSERSTIHELASPAPKASASTTHSIADAREVQSSVNEVWLEGVARLREQKCSAISSRERRIRAHMVVSEARQSFVRICALNMSHPRLAFELILRALKKSAGHVAENVVDVHCGLDLFCGSESALRMLRQWLKSPNQLQVIKDRLLSSKKWKSAVEWRGGGAAPSSESPIAEDSVVQEVRRFLFDEQYLKVERADLSQLRPPRPGCDQGELLQALAVLYNCPPTTPGLEQMVDNGSMECKQRYDILIYETPETLARQTDWVSGSYLRRLLYAKAALTERYAFFYPQKLILKAFLAFFPEDCTDSLGAFLPEFRAIENLVRWDALGEAEQVSDIATVLSLDLNMSSVPADLLAPRSVSFKRWPLLTTPPPLSEPEPAWPALHEINLEESSSLLHATSALDDIIAPSGAALDESCSPPLECSAAPDGGTLALKAGSELCYNAVITYAEYELGPELGTLSHAPDSVSVGRNTRRFPVARQRYHPLPLVRSREDTGALVLKWAMTAGQGDDYEFSVPKLKLPAPSRIKVCLDQINARHSEIAVNLSQLMSISADATREIQDAALTLSTLDDLPAADSLNNIIFSSLN